MPPKNQKKTTSPSEQPEPVSTQPEQPSMQEDQTNKKTKNPPSIVPLTLAKHVHDRTKGEADINVNVQDVKTICEKFIQEIVDKTMDGNAVSLPNYLTFKRVLRKQRHHSNPNPNAKSKDPIIRPDHYVMVVSPKNHLRNAFFGIHVTPEAKAQLDSKRKPKKTEEDAN